jgi:hypothetical protein
VLRFALNGPCVQSRCDKNGDGKLTEDEVKEVIVLSASANKLAKLKKHAATYASLIMEELDPDDRGYIEVHKETEPLPTAIVYAYTKSMRFVDADLATGNAAPQDGVGLRTA